jgi:cephalosporin hydroxylase
MIITNNINMNIPGTTSENDLNTLCNFAKELKGQGNLIVEVGTFCGRSSYVLSKNSIPGTIILTIDSWETTKVKDDRLKLDVDDTRRVFLETKRKYNLDNVIQIPNFSPLRKWNRKKIDMIFLDGRHIFEVVLAELNFYIHYCNENAIICGHDYHMHFPGVINAVECFAEEYGYSVEIYKDIIWRIRKK